MIPNKTKKIVLYTESAHDDFLLSILFFLNKSLSNQLELILITDSKKYQRLEDSKFLIENKLKIIRVIKFYRSNIPNKLVRRIINNTFRMLDYIKFKIINLSKVDNFFILESYEKYNILALMDKIKSSNNVFFTIHIINQAFIKNTIQNYLYEISSSFIVLTSHLKLELSKLTNKKILVVPYALPNNNLLSMRENILNKIQTEKIIISITGNISYDRKNFLEMFKILKTFSRHKFKLQFLGPVNDFEIIKLALVNNFDFDYFETYISPDEFMLKLLSSHFLFSITYEDKYSKNQTSGILFDALKSGVPLITNNETFVYQGVQSIIPENIERFFNDIFNISPKKYLENYGYKALNYAKAFNFDDYIKLFKNAL